MDAETLRKLVTNEAALRRRQRLQPAGGQGDKIFPPTYPGEGRNPQPRHIFERRRIGGGDTWCVLLDSVQSQANRLEESLLALIREDSIPIPHVVADFRNQNLTGLSEITSLEAPHRIYDAILRDSSLDGQPFMDSPIGQSLKRGDPIALLETSPNALLFGAWHSTGEGGGVGAKFARCLISEIVAVEVPVEEVANARTGEVEARTAGRRPGSRIDPLGILRKVEVYKGEGGWDVSQAAAGKKAKVVRPSEINHGNIAPTIQPLGITCDHIEHSFVLSFAALRRLSFADAGKDLAGRTLLAALGILAIAEQDARGYALRSRCDLVCDGRSPFEIVYSDGLTDPIEIDRKTARSLYREAYKAAETAGFVFSTEPIRLQPQPKLIEIVRKSQELALADQGGEADADSRS
jgi:CRISPR-associated protein Csb1